MNGSNLTQSLGEIIRDKPAIILNYGIPRGHYGGGYSWPPYLEGAVDVEW